MTTIQSYRDLEVWQRAMEYVVACYAIANKFPAKEVYGLTSQLQRAAVSIPANIAEGRGRQHTKEFIHHLSIAYGSLMEVETHLLIAEKLKYVNRDDTQPLLTEAAAIGRMLNGLKNSLLDRLQHD